MRRPTATASLPDPRLAAALRQLLLAGIALVLVVPAARGASHWLGALPLWLVAMPAASLWALHRFPLPRLRARSASAPVAAVARPRRRGPQARRRRQYPAASRAFSASARPISISSAARQNS
ncbi:MAG TPA: hypothetical protein VFT52_07085 [Luteimonas sp.]|jgi:hypothetical protein|nr:hypothetical protein [Luteimonas sp.]